MLYFLRAVACWVGSLALLSGGVGCIPGSNDGATPPENTRALLTTLEVAPVSDPSSVPPALSPAFDPLKTTYTMIVPNSVSAVTVKAVLTDTQRTILKIDNQTVHSGDPYLVDNLQVGVARVVGILVEEIVTAGVTRSYTLSITRSASRLADLASLALSAGGLTPAFDPQTTSYTVKAGNATTSTTVTARPVEVGAGVSVNGQSAVSGQPFGPVPLSLGPNPVTITVAPPGGTSKQYSVVVIRGASGVADLAALQVSAGALSPSFSPDTTTYTVQTSNATTQTTVTALLADASAQLSINDQAMPSGQPSPPLALAIGDNVIRLDVRAQDGTTRNYVVKVSRPQSSNNNLAALSASAGALTPAFSAATTNYAVTVLSTVTSTTITATVQDRTASLAINGTPVSSGATFGPLPLNVGPNEFKLTVTAENGTAQSYLVTITRTANADLAGLVLSAGALTPTFTPATVRYTAAVPNSRSTTSVTATLADATSTMTINGQAIASGQAFGPVALAVGDTTFAIVVTAAGNAATKSYTLVVTRAASSNAELAGLAVSPGLMTPAFSPAVTAYALNETGLFTATVTVVATVADPTAVITVSAPPTITGQVMASGPPGLVVPIDIGVTTITVQVQAQDGVTVKPYTVTVTRP